MTSNGSIASWSAAARLAACSIPVRTAACVVFAAATGAAVHAAPPMPAALIVPLALAATPVAALPGSATPRSSFAGATVSEGRLAKSRAGAAVSTVEQIGSLRQTSATNVETGANSVRDGSFANAAGLTTVIQNSGANVLIQNATTVNVQFK